MEHEIQEAINRCQSLIHRIHRLNPNLRSKVPTLLKLANSELHFLSRFSSSPSSPLSTNIGHLEAVVHLLEQPFINGVSRVCKPIPLLQAIRYENNNPNSLSKAVHVDIVCVLHKSPVWIIVSDRNPRYLSLDNCFDLRIQSVLSAARSSQMLRPNSIILFFSRGLSDSVFQHLRDEFGASQIELEFDLCEELENDWINVVDKRYQDSIFLEIRVGSADNSFLSSEMGLQLQEEQAQVNSDDDFSSLISKMNSLSVTVQSDCQLVNFDTTALIALVSGISNGCAEKLLAAPEIDLRTRFKGNYDFVIAQVLSEIQSPIHTELEGVLSGRRGMICESVVAEFKELVSLCGGPNEKLRADRILKHLMVVPDSPSERMMCLPTTRKLAMKNKVVFGTGDRWQALTLTANMAFVRAVSQTGMSLLTMEHRPRALTGD